MPATCDSISGDQVSLSRGPVAAFGSRRAERREKDVFRSESSSVVVHYTSATCVVPLRYAVGCAVPPRIISDATFVRRFGDSEVGGWKD